MTAWPRGPRRAMAFINTAINISSSLSNSPDNFQALNFISRLRCLRDPIPTSTSSGRNIFHSDTRSFLAAFQSSNPVPDEEINDR